MNAVVPGVMLTAERDDKTVRVRALPDSCSTMKNMMYLNPRIPADVTTIHILRYLASFFHAESILPISSGVMVSMPRALASLTAPSINLLISFVSYVWLPRIR